MLEIGVRKRFKSIGTGDLDVYFRKVVRGKRLLGNDNKRAEFTAADVCAAAFKRKIIRRAYNADDGKRVCVQGFGVSSALFRTVMIDPSR